MLKYVAIVIPFAFALTTLLSSDAAVFVVEMPDYATGYDVQKARGPETVGYGLAISHLKATGDPAEKLHRKLDSRCSSDRKRLGGIKVGEDEILCDLGVCDKVIAEYPDYGRTYIEKADLLVSLGREGEAFEPLDTAARLDRQKDDEAVIAYVRARALHKSGKDAEALAELDKSMEKIDPWDTDNKYKLKIDILTSLKRYDEVIKTCDKFMTRPYFPMANALMMTGRTKEAKELLDRIMIENGGGMSCAMEFIGAGYYDYALNVLDRQIAKKSPTEDDAEANENDESELSYQDDEAVEAIELKAEVYIMMGQPEKAVALLDGLIVKDSPAGHSDQYRKKAIALIQMKKYASALICIRQADIPDLEYRHFDLKLLRALALKKRGTPADMKKSAMIINKLKNNRKAAEFSPTLWAVAGDKDKMLAVLKRRKDNRFTMNRELRELAPAYEAYANDAEFKAVVGE